MEGLTQLFNSFSELFKPILDFLRWIFPLKIYKLHDGEKGVITTFGKVRKWRKPEKGSGVWAVLCFEEMFTVQAIGGYIDLDKQTITSKDKKVVIVNSAIEYSIFSVKLSILITEDIEMFLKGFCMNQIREYAKDKNLDDLLDSEKLSITLAGILNRKIKSHGVRIEKIMITDLRPHEVTYICDTAIKIVADLKKQRK